MKSLAAVCEDDAVLGRFTLSTFIDDDDDDVLLVLTLERALASSCF